MEALGEVEGEEPVAGLEVVEEGPGAGGVGEGHEVGEEGDLDGGAFDEEAGVPVEGGALFVEGGVEFGEGVGEGGEGEVEGADADADEVAGCVGLVVWGAGASGSSGGGSFHEVQESGQVVGPGVGVEEGGFEPEPAVGRARPRTARPSVRRVRRTAATVSSVASCGAEQDGADGGPVVEFEGGVRVDEVGELPGRGRRPGRRGRRGRAAEGFEGDGDLEDVGAAGGAQGAAEEVGQAGFGVVVGVEVVGVLGEGGEVVGVADGEEAGGDGLPAEFVQVEGDGVGGVEAGEAVAVAVAEEEASAVGGVDVQSGAVGGAEGGDLGEGVDEAGVGGACGGG